MFTEKDIKQIHNKGITLDQVNAQIHRLKNGMTHSNLLSAATVGRGPVTAFEEHLYEATLYASSKGNANLHFTVSEKHHDYFLKVLNAIKPKLENATNVVFNVTFSFQKEATETVALTKSDEVYRTSDGSILFRPGGHGALLENLNELDSDIIFIKNIDNIVVKEKNKRDSKYKKLLGGVLLKIQNQVFDYLKQLDGKTLDDADITAMAYFLRKQLSVFIDPDFGDFSIKEKINYLKNKLNRPIRVCGYKGEKFNLLEYVDPEAAFITMKTQNGVDIQALELPGLWNGSMAHWNSIFVEVPVETFNPVKTVNDLLKPVHQNS